jgi:hypothetical protein
MLLFLYRLFLGVAAAVALTAFYFFFVGLADGSVSSFNITLWLGLLAGVGAVLGGGLALNAKGLRGAATGVLAILAIPGLVAGLFILALIAFQPRWN